MAIDLNTIHSQGYKACRDGFVRANNPYTKMEELAKALKWDEGWTKAYNEHGFEMSVDLRELLK